MRVEHIAYMVQRPPEVAAWYCRHLGFSVRRKMDGSPWTHFILDAAGSTMLEIYNNPACSVPDYWSWDPLLFHIAFVCADVPGTVRRLVAAGCAIQSPTLTTEAGDTLAMLRDPWGLAIQLCRRGSPMVGEGAGREGG